MRRRFEALGPTYVKFGQLIASSPGVFPAVVADEFQRLLDRVSPVNPDAIEAVLIAELGRPIGEIFETFDLTPIASASMAQVHAATLRTGEAVVVKVQRPGIRRLVATDIPILSGAAGLLEISRRVRMLGLRDIVEDLAADLNDELHFRREAAAMESWAEAISGSEFADQVRVPKVYWRHTTNKILVMERLDVTRMDDVQAIGDAGHDGVTLIKTLLLVLLESIFRRGIFHGDLHAGNVQVDAQGRVVLLDWGITGRFDLERAQVLRELIVALMVTDDMSAASKAMLKLGAVGRPAPHKKAVSDIRSLTVPLGTAELSRISYADLAKQILDLGDAYQLKLPRDLVLVVKQLLYVERYIKLLAPQWKPAKDEEVVGYLAALVLAGSAEAASDPTQET
ncbi:ABC1 kinase family protein [Mycobacteroides salmoniphilum]|nr:AarF/UbiB family protein [Mycobacteroides salmoniphilum]